MKCNCAFSIQEGAPENSANHAFSQFCSRRSEIVDFALWRDSLWNQRGEYNRTDRSLSRSFARSFPRSCARSSARSFARSLDFTSHIHFLNAAGFVFVFRCLKSFIPSLIHSQEMNMKQAHSIHSTRLQPMVLRFAIIAALSAFELAGLPTRSEPPLFPTMEI